jgi:hypothetical protein
VVVHAGGHKHGQLTGPPETHHTGSSGWRMSAKAVGCRGRGEGALTDVVATHATSHLVEREKERSTKSAVVAGGELYYSSCEMTSRGGDKATKRRAER